jgi:hypothetical protein
MSRLHFLGCVSSFVVDIFTVFEQTRFVTKLFDAISESDDVVLDDLSGFVQHLAQRHDLLFHLLLERAVHGLEGIT